MAPRPPNPMTALAAAWLDAELFTRCGVRSTAHSAALLGFTGADPARKLARPDSLASPATDGVTTGQAATTVAAVTAAAPDGATRKPAPNARTSAPVPVSTPGLCLGAVAT